MKICFPVQKDEGMESTVYNHFGSAPLFVVVDTATNASSLIINRDQHHAHGACNPIMALDNQKVDAIVVGGIGGGALNRLGQMGIKAYKARAGTISENLGLFLTGQLDEYSSRMCCGGHSHGDACAH
ncbi:MAG: NifB/NifX family molybdenum-iron cluster-binding protein [Nitrospirae bacterium]|nr:NifB/NifX family molybdenum-iron cluster-binding protein [Nitrospirota bacterium]